MRCSKCGRMMTKITDSPYLLNGAYFYRCNHCFTITELMTDNNIPFGETESIDGNKSVDKDKSLQQINDLDTWKYMKKARTEAKLKTAHKKRVAKLYEQYEKYGLLTDDDVNNILIDLWEFGKKNKKGEK